MGNPWIGGGRWGMAVWREAPGDAPAVWEAGAEERASGILARGEGAFGADFVGGKMRGACDGDFAEGGGGALYGARVAVGEPALRPREKETQHLGAVVVFDVSVLHEHRAEHCEEVGVGGAVGRAMEIRPSASTGVSAAPTPPMKGLRVKPCARIP